MSNINDFVIKDGSLLEYGGSDEIVVIPDGVKEIGRYAFRKCTNVKKIVFPDSLKKLLMFAVSDCTSLEEVELPESLREIGSNAFFGCTALVSVNIPENVKKICNSAFENCTELKEICFPEKLTEIAPEAFCGCKNLTSVEIPENVKIIGNNAFSFCDNLNTVTVAGKPESIGWGAFNNCEKIENLKIPGGIVDIKNGVFANSELLCDEKGLFIYENILCCVRKDLTEITIPECVTTIGGAAFTKCNDLVKIIIPDTVTEIVRSAFFDCEKLSFVQLPIHYTDAGDIFDLFGGIAPPACIVVPSIEISKFKNDLLKTAAICGFASAKSAYTDTAIIQSYEKYIRTQRKKLYRTAVNYLPLMLYMTENGIIPLEELSAIQEMATETGNAETVAMLLNYQNTHFKTEEKQELLANEMLKDPMSAEELNKRWSTKKQPDGTLIITGYKGTETEVVVPSAIGKKTVSAIAEKAFSPRADRINASQKEIRENISSVIICDGISEIEDGAFRSCNNLKSVIIPKTVKKIGDGAFFGCRSLIHIELPAKMTNIGIGAFNGCSSLSQINIPSGLKKINQATFAECNFKKIIIPESVRRIERAAFVDCSNLINITIPAGVTCIEEKAISLNKQLEIHGVAGSYAETYAKENDIPFVAE